MRTSNVFVGTVGQDPRMGTLADDRTWANLRIAVNHEYFNGKTGEVVNRGVSWFDVSAYGALAKNVAFSVFKGDSIIVVGELRLRDWEKDGRTGTSGTIVADYVGPNLLFGVAKYTRSTALSPGTRAEEDAEQGSSWASLSDSQNTPAGLSDTGSSANPAESENAEEDSAVPEHEGVGAPF